MSEQTEYLNEYLKGSFKHIDDSIDRIDQSVNRIDQKVEKIDQKVEKIIEDNRLFKAEIKEDNRLFKTEIKAEVDEIKTEVRAEIAEVKADNKNTRLWVIGTGIAVVSGIAAIFFSFAQMQASWMQQAIIFALKAVK